MKNICKPSPLEHYSNGINVFVGLFNVAFSAASVI
jgi:hypothetical protein